MKVYVLSWFSADEKIEDGVYGAYSSLERAERAMNEYANDFNETILDTDYDVDKCDVDKWFFFTDKGTYEIKAMFLDDNAGM